MGLTAIASSTSAGVSSAVSMFTAVGTGPGGLFVATALVVVLAYLNVFDASDVRVGGVRRVLLGSVLALGVTFALVFLYRSLTLLELL